MALLLSTQAASQTDEARVKYSNRFNTCTNQADGSYTRIIGCLSEEQVRQELVLNSIYRELSHGLGPSERRALIGSERSWVLERERKCPLNKAAGLSDEVDIRMCRLDQTVLRIQYLKHDDGHR